MKDSELNDIDGEIGLQCCLMHRPNLCNNRASGPGELHISEFERLGNPQSSDPGEC